MKIVVAATDFSSTSMNAVNYAADLAAFINADLTLINVCPIPISFEMPIPGFMLEQMLKEAEEEMGKMKIKILERNAGKIKVNVVAKLGTVISQINEYCESIEPFAVVMGSENIGGLERTLSGNNTTGAIKRISCPLIIVPPEGKFLGIKKIGLACDFNDVIDTLPIEKIKDLVNTYHPELFVLNVSMEGTSNSQIVEESAWLQEMLYGMDPKYEFVQSTSIEEGINSFAKKNNLDMLIMVPKHHNIISKIFQHSHSKQMAIHTQLPIFAMHE
jgi:nucleotide-binding universal stress UspA family protein